MNIEDNLTYTVDDNDDFITSNNQNAIKIDGMSIILKNNALIIIVDILKDLIENCEITFSQNKIIIKTTDSLSCCFIDIELNDIFEKNELETKKICVNLNEFHKILSCKEKSDKCVIKFDDDFITIMYHTIHNSIDKYKLRLNYIDENNEEEYGELKINGNTKLYLSSSYFSQLCKKIKKFDDNMQIITNAKTNNVYFQTNNINLNLIKSDANLCKIKIHDDIHMKLLLKYLLLFSKSEKIADIVILKMDDNCSPIEIKYKFDKSKISFYLSSLIDD